MHMTRVSLAMLLFAVTGLLAAAGAMRGFERDFDRIDRNGDGLLSWAEFESHVIEMFYFADLDNNGRLTYAEAPPGIRDRWDEFDRKDDGRLSLAEFIEHHRRMFEAADANGDGSLSRQELDALPRPQRGRRR
jgi:hypothetical protein